MSLSDISALWNLMRLQWCKTSKYLLASYSNWYEFLKSIPSAISIDNLLQSSRVKNSITDPKIRPVVLFSYMGVLTYSMNYAFVSSFLVARFQ